MKNYKTKKNKTGGVFKAIATLALSAVMLVGGGVIGYGAGTHWTYKRGNAQAVDPDKPNETDVTIGGGDTETNNDSNLMRLSTGENRGLKCSTRALKPAEYREYEIDAQSIDSAHVATVTLANHSEASDKSITLSAEFTSEWAKNLDVYDFIGFSSTTVQSGEEFTITCLQAFEYPITIKATANGSISADNGEKAFCSVRADYIRRFTGIHLMTLIRTRVGYDTNERTRFHFTLNSVGEDYHNTSLRSQSEAYTNWTNAVYALAEAQFGPNAIALYYDDEFTTSIGTLFEEITDVQIDITDGHEPGWVTLPPAILENQLSSHIAILPEFQDNHEDYNFYVEDESLLNYLDSYITNQGSPYQSALERYNNKISNATLWVTFTGKLSGIKYNFATDLIINPKYSYISAQSPSFDSNTGGGIMF